MALVFHLASPSSHKKGHPQKDRSKCPLIELKATKPISTPTLGGLGASCMAYFMWLPYGLCQLQLPAKLRGETNRRSSRHHSIAPNSTESISNYLLGALEPFYLEVPKGKRSPSKTLLCTSMIVECKSCGFICWLEATLSHLCNAQLYLFRIQQAHLGRTGRPSRDLGSPASWL